MADPNATSAPKPGPLEKVKSGAAVMGALAGAITALYGVYEKVRSDAKEYTAASYNTLAPQMNQIGEALKQLQQENQQLRDIVAQHQGAPRIAIRPPAARKPSGNGARKPGAAPARPAGAAGPATAEPTTEQATSPAASAGTAPSEPAAPATSAPPGTTAGAPAAEPAPSGAQPTADPVGGLLNTVGRTRAAIESLRKVPEDFEKVVGQKGK